MPNFPVRHYIFRYYHIFIIAIMPPKTSKSSTKTEKRNQAKVIEDKTFGLKNKNKSTTVKKFISTVTKTVQNRDKELAAASVCIIILH